MLAEKAKNAGELLRLVLFSVIVVVGAAVAVRPLVARREPFDRALFARVQARQPEFVLIGDSLLGYSIDLATLGAAIGGRRVELLWHGGAASAAWFLHLKNFVAGSGAHPRRLLIFVHDDVLTNPRFRTTGKYAQGLQRLMLDDEPVFRTVATTASENWWLQRWILALFPADQNRAH